MTIPFKKHRVASATTTIVHAKAVAALESAASRANSVSDLLSKDRNMENESNDSDKTNKRFKKGLKTKKIKPKKKQNKRKRKLKEVDYSVLQNRPILLFP